MKRHWLVLSVLAGLAALCFDYAYAIDPNRMISQYVRESWGSEKGFSGGTVTSIAQTPDGYLWIGTEKGLIRFDGLNFRLFQQATPINIPIGPVQELIGDAQSNLWILLKNTTILRYHDGKFELGRDEAEHGITSIGKRKDGTVLFSSFALGTLAYHAGKFETLTPSTAPTNSPEFITAGPLDNLSTRLSWATGVVPHRIAEPNSAVIAMAESSDGRLWLGTRDKGLFYLKDGQIVSTVKRWSSGKINCLLPVENGEVWIGTDDGVLRWNGSELTRVSFPSVLNHMRILSLARDRDSNTWLGTSRGLFRSNVKGISFADETTSQPNLAVTSLFEDREGNLWIGTAAKIERLRDSPFVTYTVSKGLPSESNGPVYVDSEERTWFAPLDGGLHWLKGERVGSITDAGLDRDVVYSIDGNASGLWIGRQQGGLTNLLSADGGITIKTYTHLDGLTQDSVYAVHQSRDGTVWAGTLSGGVSELRNGRFTTYTTAQGMSSNTVASIVEGFDGTMWFATPNGLNKFSHGQWRVYAAHDGLPSAEVNCLLEDSVHVLWIGTAAGLAFLDSTGVHIPAKMPGPLHEQILGIAEDRNGWLWIATSSHVLRVKRDRILGATLGSEDVREYGLADGLNGIEGVKRHRSVIADPLGRIWFSMNHGLSVVDPIRATNNVAPVLVKIDGISADGIQSDLGEPIHIPSIRQRTTFSFAGLSLSIPERVRYRYRLDGFDRAWSEPVATQEAVYTNLSPGSYRFRVIACNSDGLWNYNGPSVQLTIVPEFYQTKWFLLLCAAIAGSLAWAAYQWHVGQMTDRLHMQFTERLSERTRIARELHDTLLQTFQGLILHFQTARDLLQSRPAEASEKLDTALESADQAMVEGRNAIYDIRSSTVVDDDLAHAIGALGDELRANYSGKGDPAALSVVVEGTAKPLDPICRDDIYHIVREALRNSYRHGEAKSVEAEIAYGKRSLRVRIRDDGKGIDPKVLAQGGLAGHWGMAGMRERAKRIGGRLVVWSELEAGTEVELSIPGSVVYASSLAETDFQQFYKKR
ncbi:sensor histidine kinase [Tunturiibacter lichenicola]|uniref:sensor histidine kinase n=1 Tax=Tunturiibacter lichenicola TaxID=2051959 RepID=UPI003D9B9A85